MPWSVESDDDNVNPVVESLHPQILPTGGDHGCSACGTVTLRERESSLFHSAADQINLGFPRGHRRSRSDPRQVPRPGTKVVTADGELFRIEEICGDEPTVIRVLGTRIPISSDGLPAYYASWGWHGWAAGPS
jgi:hypothetical protein